VRKLIAETDFQDEVNLRTVPASHGVPEVVDLPMVL
jgi:hypothetical protein